MTIANTEMAKAWDGEEGDHWTEYADRYDASSAAYWQRFLGHGLIASGDRVLDVGCGTGQSTRDAARAASAGSALGADLSARMLARARERAQAEGLTNVEFLQADVQVHPFDSATYDVAISRFGAMFFADREAAFANIAQALRPGGRLALLAWRGGLAGNEWITVIRDALAASRDLPEPPLGLPGPFGLADADGVRAMLGKAGFVDVELTELDEPVRFGSDAADAWAFVSQIGIVKGLSHDLDDATREAAHDKLRTVLAERESAAGVRLASSAWLITARRT